MLYIKFKQAFTISYNWIKSKLVSFEFLPNGHIKKFGSYEVSLVKIHFEYYLNTIFLIEFGQINLG